MNALKQSKSKKKSRPLKKEDKIAIGGGSIASGTQLNDMDMDMDDMEGPNISIQSSDDDFERDSNASVHSS